MNIFNDVFKMIELKEYLPQIVASAIAVVLLPLSKYVARKLVNRYGAITQKAEMRMRQVKQVMSLMINITFVLVLAIIWGLQPQNLLFGLSSIFAILGVALFAQWSLLSNITAGIVMFFSAPYRIGDRIHIIDKDTPIYATIETIGVFYIHIRTDDDELVVLPNNLFLQKIVSVKGS